MFVCSDSLNTLTQLLLSVNNDNESNVNVSVNNVNVDVENVNVVDNVVVDEAKDRNVFDEITHILSERMCVCVCVCCHCLYTLSH